MNFKSKIYIRISFRWWRPLRQSLASVVLIMFPLRDILQVLHVSDQHRSQLDEIAMLGVFHFHHAPRIQTTANLQNHLLISILIVYCSPYLTAPDLQQRIGAAYGERHGLFQLAHLFFILFVLVRIALGQRENLDAVLGDFVQHFPLQLLHFLLGEDVGFGDHRNYVYFVV